MKELADCDLIIEAVFEDMTLKTDIFSGLDGIAKHGAVATRPRHFIASSKPVCQEMVDRRGA